MNAPVFPFSALVAQTPLQTALLLCAIDPSLGGVLIRGDKGTAKSTAARGLTDVLPPIDRVMGCAFNCAPGAAFPECAACHAADALPQPGAVPFVTLPLGASEDRVLGTLDIERALQTATRSFQPGLLAAAHRGVLYIDEVNLLPDHLVDVLLDAAAMGVNNVQREGLSIAHPARFTLIGTMNLEEGDLRPQLLDRFGLMVEVVAPRDKALRAEVVRRRIAFETDSQGFAAQWADAQNALRARVATAQRLLPGVALSDALLDLISHLCCEFDVASLRADIVMHKAARALAALAGRTSVTPEDVRGAAEYALPHRRRRKPFEQPGLDRERLDELMQGATPPSPRFAADSSATSQQDSAPHDSADEVAPEVFGALPAGRAPRILVEVQSPQAAVGRRSVGTDAARGRVIRAVPDEQPSSLAVAATLRSAVLRSPQEFQVKRGDFHQQVRSGQHANLIMFVVDASGSMAAQRRMAAVKGAVLALLTDAYQRRDEVAVIAFRGESATLLLPPTRSVDRAEQSLRELPTGGRTPLAHALQLVLELLAKNDNKTLPPLLVLLSDGKANVAVDNSGDPWQETLTLAAQLAERRVPALVLDTENGFLRLGRARHLAAALGAECLTLEDLSAESLTLTIRGVLR